MNLRKILFAIFIFTSVSGTFAQRITSNFPNCQNTQRYTTWSNCFGDHAFVNGDSYSGEWKDGKYHGQGVFIFKNGNRYSGGFREGKYDGRGISVYSNGEKYEGDFKDGVYNGHGKYTFSDGSTYVGDFKDGQHTDKKRVFASREKIKQDQISDKEENLVLQNKPSELSKVTPQVLSPLTSSASQSNNPQLNSQSTQIFTPSVTNLSTPGKRLALVIGNQAYRVRPLLNPRNDADDMSKALKNAGFEVIDVRDASLSQMRNAVRQFGDRLLTRDVGLVYYSGHGIEVRGRNYFIPVNADIKRSDEIADQSLDVNLILEKMETAKKGVNILIVDACRDDPFGRSFRSSSRGLANMDAPQGTIIAFATSPGKVAADGDGRNSPYTKNLIKTMQIPNLPIEQVFKQVRIAVQQETKNQQTPWENTSLSGDFYFSVKK